MIYEPEKYKVTLEDVNKKLMEFKGEMSDKDARITLAKFLRANIGLTVELISGVKLFPYQEITLKAFFNRNFSMCVWGRGCSKSWLAAIYCFLQCIFDPNTKILIAGPTFRTARNIFTELEKIVESPGAEMLYQCFGKKERRNDLFEWQINGGSIKAIPLNGEKIRGFRANILLLDEYLLLSEEMVEKVLMPFLVANRNVKERIEIKEIEDELVAAGKMKDEDRKKFVNDTKMICLTSASYTFENAYVTYTEWLNKIYDNQDDNLEAKYFISQMSWESIPKELLSKTLLEEAQNGGASHASFQREYCAQFVDGSDGYFSAKKMLACTIPDGQEPHLQLVAEPGKQYIFSIDPSFSNSETSDNFSIEAFELDNERKEGSLVHNYAVAGGDLKDHIKYFFYMYMTFKPIFIIIDNAGFQFIDSCNESELFRDAGIELKFFDFETDKEGEEYNEALREARRQYNLQSGRICIKQVFASDFIRKANEHLQACIDHKKIWFASRIRPDGYIYDKVMSQKAKIPFDTLMGYKKDAFEEVIDDQDVRIKMVKKECSLIEVSQTSRGTQSFDLPQHLKRSSSPDRARKDSYTALMLGNWAIKCYYDMMNTPVQTVVETFTPRMIGKRV
jgi:hypothetical protein